MVRHQYIVLKGIDMTEIDKKYGLGVIVDNESVVYGSDMEGASSNRVTMPTTTDTRPRTSILEISNSMHESKKQGAQAYLFLDEARNQHTVLITMRNLVDEWLPATTDLCCFWCRHGFPYVPIGCPVQYVTQRLEKKIPCDHKDDVIVRENISKSVFKSLHTDLHNSFINKECYYRVDGVFCSFPCCLAFIRDNQSNNILYQYSENFLRLMHGQCFPEANFELSPAPSWRLLKAYGGDLDIVSFRESLLNTDYVDHHQHIHRLPMQKMTGFLFESQIKI